MAVRMSQTDVMTTRSCCSAGNSSTITTLTAPVAAAAGRLTFIAVIGTLDGIDRPMLYRWLQEEEKCLRTAQRSHGVAQDMRNVFSVELPPLS